MLIIYRIILGVAEGIYWPQQFRFARAWFTKEEITRGTNLIQFYGQLLALSLGFLILTPIFTYLSWQWVFYITGGLGVLIVVPLFLIFLKNAPDTPLENNAAASADDVPAKGMVSFRDLDGAPFLLLIFSYFANGMLLWGVTLFIPMVVSSLGFSGLWQGLASSLPYFLAILSPFPCLMSATKPNGAG